MSDFPSLSAIVAGVLGGVRNIVWRYLYVLLGTTRYFALRYDEVLLDTSRYC